MAKTKDVFVSWLQNAYAMETGLIEILEAHRDQADGYPDVQKKIAEHLSLTKEHADRVKKCLHDLHEEPSNIKSALQSFVGTMSGAVSSMPGDRVIKNGIADFAAEHMEIATYSALIVAAEELEYSEIADTCMEILAQEQEMALWLEENLPISVKTYLDEVQTDNTN